MCTAISFSKKNFYFGRNLDLEYSYREEVTVVPRNFPFTFRGVPAPKHHGAMIGMAYVQDGYPLFYDAVNEYGLCAAGLNFPKSAVYFPPKGDGNDLAPFEVIPYLLATCKSVSEAKERLSSLRLASISFSPELPLTPLHWIVSDRTGSIVVESVEDGLHVYENPVGVLTNEPPFPSMCTRLADFSALSPYPIENNFPFPVQAYSRGMGAMGLPGDLSSASRFVKAAFVKHHSRCGESEQECVGQFFHILTSVEQQRGCVRLEKGDEITVYASCCNADTGVYYFVTYGNRRINAVDMHKCDLDGRALTCFSLMEEEDILCRN